MSGPLPVTIVRPKGTFLGELIHAILSNLLNGWLVMLVAPLAVNAHPSYWHSVGFYFLVRTLVADRGYLAWTKSAAVKKRARS